MPVDWRISGSPGKELNSSPPSKGVVGDSSGGTSSSAGGRAG